MSIKIAASVAALIIGSTLHAAALEGYDGDNNRVPGAAVTKSVLASGWHARMPHASDAFAKRTSNKQASNEQAPNRDAWNAWAERASQVH